MSALALKDIIRPHLEVPRRLDAIRARTSILNTQDACHREFVDWAIGIDECGERAAYNDANRLWTLADPDISHELFRSEVRKLEISLAHNDHPTLWPLDAQELADDDWLVPPAARLFDAYQEARATVAAA
jgi:hypothetical protein